MKFCPTCNLRLGHHGDIVEHRDHLFFPCILSALVGAFFVQLANHTSGVSNMSLVATALTIAVSVLIGIKMVQSHKYKMRKLELDSEIAKGAS